MGLRPTKGDGKAPSVQQPLSMGAPPSPLSSRAEPRDLQFRGPFLEMFFGINPDQVERILDESMEQQNSMIPLSIS